MTAPLTANQPPASFTSGEAFLGVIEAAPVVMLVADRAGRIVLANAEARRLFGYTEAELRGLTVGALFSEKHLSSLAAFLTRFWQAPARHPVESGAEFQVRRKDDREIWAQLGLNPVEIDGTVYALAAVLDISARKRAEEERVASERTMRAILDHSFEFTGLLDIEGRMLRSNRTALQVAAVTWEEVKGRLFWETPWWTHSSVEQAKLREAVGRAARGEFVRFETTHRGPGGRLLTVDFSLKPIRDEFGVVTALVPEGRDVTERKCAEQALRESEEKFSKVFHASPDAISVHELGSGSCVDANENFLRLFGYTRAELIGRRPVDLGIWPDIAQREKYVEILRTHGTVRDFPAKVRLRNGEIRSVRMSSDVVEIGGRPHNVTVLHDMTDKLHAEEAMRESEEKFSKAFRASPDAIAITDLETGCYIDANGGHEQIFGFTREEAIGRTTLELGYYRNPADRDRLVAEIRAHGSVRNLELECNSRDRGPITVIYSGEAIEMKGKKYLVSVVHDITDRKRAEEALRDSEARFRSYFESPFIGMAITATDSRWLEVNDYLCRMLGYSREELLGMRWGDVTVSEDLGESEAFVARALAGEVDGSTFEKRYRRRDGSVLHANVSTRLFRRSDGTPGYFLTVIQDVTERHEAEAARARLEDQLRQAQKLEALGTLAGGIAHDFNNILTAIVVYRELAVMDIDVPGELRKHLAEIGQASNRAKELVRQILTFSRQQKQERRTVRLHPVVREALQLLRSSLPSTLEMDLHIDEQSPEVLADSGQVHQIVMNLATNAAHAMRDRPGLLTVRLVPQRVDEEFCRTHRGLRPGLYAHLSVTDTGHGMDEATLAHIFEPFFTTKAPGEGTGLGLAVVHGIMEDHDGAIFVRSRPGEGTTFDLFFPQHAGAVQVTTEHDVTVPRGRGESVLLVDDEPPLCEAISTMLKKIGYRVTACTDSTEAVGRFAAAPASFDLVVTDHTMPRLTGLDVIREVHARRLGIPVLLISGLSGTWTPEKLRGFDIQEVVAKPLNLAGLAQSVRRALDQSGKTIR